MTSQNSSTLQWYPKEQGARFGRDLTLTFNQKPYINADILLDDIRTVFVPYPDIFRGLAVLVQEIAV
jgi:hypothetical protein